MTHTAVLSFIGKLLSEGSAFEINLPLDNIVAVHFQFNLLPSGLTDLSSTSRSSEVLSMDFSSFPVGCFSMVYVCVMCVYV